MSATESLHCLLKLLIYHLLQNKHRTCCDFTLNVRFTRGVKMLLNVTELWGGLEHMAVLYRTARFGSVCVCDCCSLSPTELL